MLAISARLIDRLKRHQRALPPFKNPARIFKPAYSSNPARVRKIARRFDFRSHGPGREHIAVQFGRRYFADRPLIHRSPSVINGVHIGQHQESVGSECFGEQTRRPVLVYDCLKAVKRAVCIPRHGDAAAAGANDRDACLHEETDRFDLGDPRG